MCEDVQHDLETYSLLSTLPQSFSREGIANISSAVEDIMPEIKQIYMMLSFAIVFALRGWQLYCCTQEDLDEDPCRARF